MRLFSCGFKCYQPRKELSQHSLPTSRVKFRDISYGDLPTGQSPSWQVLFGPCGCLTHETSPAQQMGRAFKVVGSGKGTLLDAHRQGRPHRVHITRGDPKRGSFLPSSPRYTHDPHTALELSDLERD